MKAMRILQRSEGSRDLSQLTYDSEDDTPTTIRLRVPKGERSHLLFMLDNGATVNTVKLGALFPELTVDTNKSLKIGGITAESM